MRLHGRRCFAKLALHTAAWRTAVPDVIGRPRLARASMHPVAVKHRTFLVEKREGGPLWA